MDKCPAATEPTQRKEYLYAILLLGVVNRPKHSDESPQRCFIFAESSLLWPLDVLAEERSGGNYYLSL